MNAIKDKKIRNLFMVLGGIFITNTLIAELIGVKIFSLEDTLGISTWNWNLLGVNGSLQFTAGVLIWPAVFILTDIINEYFGFKGVRYLSFFTVLLIAYVFVILFIAIGVEPASWWIGSSRELGVDNMQNSFAAIFGQSMWIIVASIIAFLIGQLIDSLVFKKLKSITKGRKIWLRATGSTLISQFIDSYVVLYIAFVMSPANWPMEQFFAIGTVNYCYKFIVAIGLTPLIYFAHSIIDRYLGPELAHQLKTNSLAQKES